MPSFPSLLQRSHENLGGLKTSIGENYRLFDLINRVNRDDPNGAFKILVQGSGAAGASAAQNGGILSQLFGGAAGANARQSVPTVPQAKELDVVDGQVVKGGRSGVSFHEGHFKYRLTGAQRAIAVDYLGLPVAVRMSGARTHEVQAARELLDPLGRTGRG